MIFFGGVCWMSFPQLVDRAVAVAAVLAELNVHRKEPVLITLPEGPGFVESFAGTVDQEALPLPAGPLLSASELAAAAAAARPGWCWPRRISCPPGPSWTPNRQY
jgi:acyl-CoA synthetase (AMP-forming)/AMP-acid ligase II